MDKGFLCDYLLLLVGGNPLPNAIAGKLLTAPRGRIMLVHSRETADVAQRLYSWLKSQDFDVNFKQVQESRPISVVCGVQEHLNDIQPRRIGLNYTGGTKAMSVHAYRTVEQWAKEKGATPVFSYLDARKLEMIFDPADSASSEQEHGEYVGRELKLELADLLALHGWTLKHPPNPAPDLAASASALAKACAGEDSMKEWRRWIQDVLRANCRKPGKDEWKSKSALTAISLTLPSSPSLSGVVQSLRSELNLSTEELPLNKYPDNNAEHFCAWLDGKWLEHYALKVLNCLGQHLNLHQRAQKIETNEVQFDVDVIALRGYQLFALSCSTDSSKRLLKSKLFEAFIRARQLGGDEARVALVCCSNDPEGLEHEMRRDIDPEGRICVFGRKHLSDLPTHLTRWIQSQSGEE